ncbi:DUF2795 domain-containing protein [Streptomyces tricolor]|nr:DUF2795 domain-containing protein [Streptomyces tricolor]
MRRRARMIPAPTHRLEEPWRVSPHLTCRKPCRAWDYPATSEQLQKVAKKNHASKEITDRISHLGKKEFQNPAEVSKAVFQNE